jgi:hypothetical protein
MKYAVHSFVVFALVLAEPLLISQLGNAFGTSGCSTS